MYDTTTLQHVNQVSGAKVETKSMDGQNPNARYLPE